MRENKKRILRIIILGITLNIILPELLRFLHIPFLRLGTMGTVLSSALLGPIGGITTGIISTLYFVLKFNIYGITNIIIPIFIVILIGIIIGIVAKKKNFNLIEAIITGIFLGMLISFIGLIGILTTFLFEYLQGIMTEKEVLYLFKIVLSKAVIPDIISNVVNLIIQCLVILIVVKKSNLYSTK